MNFKLNLRNRKSKLMSLPVMCLALTLVYSSCDKDKDSTPRPDTAELAVFHGSTEADSINFSLDGNKVNSKLIGLGQSVDYVDAVAGDRASEVKNKAGASLIKKTIKLDKDKTYSLFITNAKDDEDLEYVLISDNLTNPATGKAKVRFIHTSPDAAKLNLATEEGDDLFTGREFKSASEFKEVSAEKQSFEIIDQATDEVLATLEEVDIKAGKIYTIWVSGLQDTEDDDLKIKAKVFTNN